MDSHMSWDEWCRRRLNDTKRRDTEGACNKGELQKEKTVKVEKIPVVPVVPVKKEDDFDMYLTAVKKRFHHIIGDRECVISCRLVDTIHGYERRYSGTMSNYNHVCTSACYDKGEGKYKHNIALHNGDLEISVRKWTEERPYDKIQPTFETAVETGPLVIKVIQEGLVVLQIANYIKRHKNRQIGPLGDKVQGTFKFFVPPTYVWNNKRILDYSEKNFSDRETLDYRTTVELFCIPFEEKKEEEITQNLIAYGFRDESDKDYTKRYKKIDSDFGTCKVLQPISHLYFALCMKRYEVEIAPGIKGLLPSELTQNILKYMKEY